MHIDWSSLTEVAVVAAAAALTVVLLVSLALVALSGGAEERGSEDGEATLAPTRTAVAGLCLGAAALIVGYGLYLIVS